MLYFVESFLKSVTFLTVCLLLTTVSGWGAPQRTATIVASGLNVRKAPDVKAERVTVLPQGATVEVLDYANGWLKISHNWHTGYIRNKKDFVRVAGTAEDLKELKTRAEQINRKIEEHRSDLEKFNQKESSLSDRLDSIARSLQQAESRAEELRSKIDRLEINIQTTRETDRILEKRISENKDYATNRLVALYKLSRLGKLNVLGTADSVYDFLRTKKDISYVYQHDRETLQTYLENRSRLKSITQKLMQEKREKHRLEKKLRQQIAAMKTEKAERKHLLKEIRQKEALRRKAMASLKKDARALDETIDSLYVKPDKGKDLPGEFSARKGSLKMPVKGKIISEFGRYRDKELDIVNFRSGIDIRASLGEPIKAVFRGRVLYATWFKGYGNMIIIDHGESYYTVYAHAQELFKEKGDYVETHEVIATVGETATLSAEPSLYFEVRHKGKPVDPTLWLQTG